MKKREEKKGSRIKKRNRVIMKADKKVTLREIGR
jgi:hypothetical protein